MKFLHGDVYRAYSFVGDAAGAIFLIGIGWADRAALRTVELASLPHSHQKQDLNTW